MNTSSAKKRISKLREEISRLRFKYHVENDPEVTDDVYDSLSRELAELLQQYPEFNDPNAAENRVAGKPLEKFTKVVHEKRMLSISNVFSEDELIAWEKRNTKLLSRPIEEYFCELKLDGLAISLIYEDGCFVRGATRGDGSVGEDITENLKMVRTVPLTLQKPYPKRIEVRGEVIMRKEILERLNKKNAKEGKPLFANSRNAAAGGLRQLDANLAKERELDFFAYEIASIQDEVLSSYVQKHSLKHELLSALGFTVDLHVKKIKKITETMGFLETIANIRTSLPFGIDGIVVNVDDTRVYEELGVAGKDPRGIVAFKYPAEKATTSVLDITVHVGRTGILTPLAHFNPTLVAGSTVSKATLHNMDQIERLDIRVGDTVVIQKAGDVIPEVVEVLINMRTGKEKKFKMPAKCPVCGSLVERRTAGVRPVTFLDGPRISSAEKNSGRGQTIEKSNRSNASNTSVAYYCTNKHCPAKNARMMQHFVNVFEIYTIGPKILERLKDEGLISDAADLFSLEIADLSGLERFGAKSAENIIASIATHKKVPLWRFLFALGIIHVGEQTARDIASHFTTLEKLMHASVAEIEHIENIGPVVAASVVSYFKQPDNVLFVKKLFENGITIEKTIKTSGGVLSGKTFVLTGTLPTLSRDEVKEKIQSNGGKVSGSVSKATSYVIVGDEPGSKYTDAQRLNVPILSEEDFLKLLK